jgi:hypothetical protein
MIHSSIAITLTGAPVTSFTFNGSAINLNRFFGNAAQINQAVDVRNTVLEQNLVWSHFSWWSAWITEQSNIASDQSHLPLNKPFRCFMCGVPVT